MSEDIDSDLLISLVEERPVLWDKTIDDYKDKHSKTEGWKEICRIIFPDFDDKNNKEKRRLGNAVVKKWTHMKDNFTKYLKKLEDLNKSGSGAKKNKEYHLYKQLLFLKKNVANITDSSIMEEDQEEDIENEKKENNRSRYQPPSRKRKSNDEVEYELLQALKETENRHLSFFKAILPSLNKFDDHQTLIFQSRVLQILTDLNQIPYQCQNQIPYQYQNQIPYQYQTPSGYQTASQDWHQRSQSSYQTNYQPTKTFTNQSSSNVPKTQAQTNIHQPSTSTSTNAATNVTNPRTPNPPFEELSNDYEVESNSTNATLESTFDFS